jgi:hypothetical protein
VGLVFAGAALLLFPFMALAGGALAATILLAAAGLALAVTGAFWHARSMDG